MNSYRMGQIFVSVLVGVYCLLVTWPSIATLVTVLTFVTQGPKTRRLSGIIYGDKIKNRREGFSSLKLFISAGLHKFVII